MDTARRREIKKMMKKGGGILDKKSAGEKVLFAIVFCIFLVHSFQFLDPMEQLFLEDLFLLEPLVQILVNLEKVLHLVILIVLN